MVASAPLDPTAPVSPGSDAVLLAAFARDGDAAAFGELVRRHGPVAHGACRRVLADPADADDAYQAALIVLARRAGQVRDPGRLGPWLYGVALRCAKRAKGATAARHARERPLPDLPARAAPDDWHDVRPVLDAEIDRLPEKLRAALVLCELQGVDRPAAAARLRIPPGTLSSRLARAKDALRANLVRRGVTLTAAGLAAALTEAQATAAPPAAAAPSAAAQSLAHLETTVLAASSLVKLLLALLTAAALTAAGVALLPADPPPKPAPPDPAEEWAELLGEWRVTAVMTGGEAQSDAMLGMTFGPRVFGRDGVRQQHPLDGREVKPQRFVVSRGVTPKRIDLPDAGPGDKARVGIFKIDPDPAGDVLTIAWADTPAAPGAVEAARPKDFVSRPGPNGGTVEVLRRVKNGAAAELIRLAGDWEVALVRLDGAAQADGGAFGKGPLRFTGDVLDVPGWTATARVRVDPAVTPRGRLDVTQTWANGDRRTSVGTYALDGDTLAWHLADPDEAKPGLGRPAGLTPSPPGTGHLLVLLKRPAATAAQERAKLLGEWRITGGNEADGRDVPAGGRVTFTAATVDPLGRPASYTLDPAAQPRRIDLTVTEGARRMTIPGVYKLDGDVLTVHLAGSNSALAAGAKGRPNGFDKTLGSFRLVLTRAKPDPVAPDRAKLAGEWRICDGSVMGGPGREVVGRVATFTADTADFNGPGFALAKDRYTLDPTAVPKRIDLTNPDRPGVTVPGVYNFVGDSLVVRVAGEGAPTADAAAVDRLRPKDFRPTADGKGWRLVLKRVDPKVAAAERAKLRGEWEVQRVWYTTPRPDPAGRKGVASAVTFTDTGVVWEDMFGPDTPVAFVPELSPRGIDLTVTENGAPRKRPGIYKIDGDTLTLHLPDPAVPGVTPRPADFELKTNSKTMLVVLKRRPDPAATDKAKLTGTWKLTRCVRDGKDDPDALNAPVGQPFRAVFFDGTSVTLPGHRPGTYTVGPAAGGAGRFDLLETATELRGMAVAAAGVCKLDGDTLMIHTRTGAAVAAETFRPADFDCKPGGGSELLVFERTRTVGPTNEDRFRGAWSIVSAELDGDWAKGAAMFGTDQAVNAGVTLFVDSGRRNFTLEYDPAGGPDGVTVRELTDKGLGPVWPGVCKFDGDMLTLHFATAAGAAAPKDFTPTKPGTGNLLVVLKRTSGVRQWPGTAAGRVTLAGKPATGGRVTVYHGPGKRQFVGGLIANGAYTLGSVPTGPVDVVVEAEFDDDKRTVRRPNDPGPAGQFGSQARWDFELK